MAVHLLVSDRRSMTGRDSASGRACENENPMAPDRTSLAPPETALNAEAEDAAGVPAPEIERPLPARRERERMRDFLPAIEPERRVNDWGRSERIEGVFDRTLVEFFYRYWFRCEVEGIENVPSDGGAPLASNHSGALPPDAAVIAKAIRDEHSNPRPLNITVEH